MPELPALYLRDAKNKLRVWSVRTDGAMVITSYGSKDGKMTGDRYVAKAKNLGRSNQTTAIQQAQCEAAALFTKKIDEGYDPDPAVAQVKEVFLPMLAKRADKVLKAGKLKWPCYGQRKFNGMRCLSRIVAGPHGAKAVELFSRLGEPLNVPHIAADLNPFGKLGDVFDGEFYCHGVPLQTIVSLVKDNRPESQALSYYLYDMPKAQGDVTMPWEDRWEHLKTRMFECDIEGDTDTAPAGAMARANSLCLAETVLFNSPLDLDAFEKTAIGDGFEGVMLRPAGGKYKLNVRSSELLKVKRYKDAEFTVIDALMRHHHGIGKDIVDVFVLQNDQSEASFKAVPKGTIQSRAEMWLKRDDYIGQQATVRFFERSIDLLPIGNPVFINLRSALDATNGEPDEDDAMWSNNAE